MLIRHAGDLQRNDRQDTLQSTYFDGAALDIEQEAQAVMQHMRTTFPATGAPYQRNRTDALQEFASNSRPGEDTNGDKTAPTP